MHAHHRKEVDIRRIGRGAIFRLLAITAVAGIVAVGVCLWLARPGSPADADWKVVNATVTGVTANKESMNDNQVPVLYRGRYGIQFSANGKSCFTWISAGVADPDRGWVLSQISKDRNRQVSVRYNPRRCEEAELDK